MAAAGAYAGHPIGSPQPHSWERPRLILLFIILCACAFGVTAGDGPPSEIDPNTYNANGTFTGTNCFFGAQMNKDVSVQYEWCADCGTNRFVTNDINDFVPGSIRREQTTVAVGGGTVISPCTGTVMVRNLDYRHIINCSDVLYLPKCAKKLHCNASFSVHQERMHHDTRRRRSPPSRQNKRTHSIWKRVRRVVLLPLTNSQIVESQHR